MTFGSAKMSGPAVVVASSAGRPRARGCRRAPATTRLCSMPRIPTASRFVRIEAPFVATYNRRRWLVLLAALCKHLQECLPRYSKPREKQTARFGDTAQPPGRGLVTIQHQRPPACLPEGCRHCALGVEGPGPEPQGRRVPQVRRHLARVGAQSRGPETQRPGWTLEKICRLVHGSGWFPRSRH